MAKRMLLHDQSLRGSPPPIAQNIYSFPHTVSTRHVVGWSSSYARSQSGLDDLIIMCHGGVLRTMSSLPGEDDLQGASGLSLGTPGLRLNTAGLADNWSGLITRIVIYACGAGAPTTSGDPTTDGFRFCGELALRSGAKVIAANMLQWYSRAASNNRINFGTWEGTVYSFSPDTGLPTVLPPSKHPTF